MAKGRRARPRDVDIFEDDDLARAQSLLEEEDGANPVDTATLPLAAVASPAAGTVPVGGAGASVEEHDEGAGAETLGVSRVEATDAHLKFRVRRPTRARFDSFKAELSVALGGVRLMDSNLGRALLDWFLFEAGDRVLESVVQAPADLQRPPSDDPVAMAEFDNALTEIVRRALATS